MSNQSFAFVTNIPVMEDDMHDVCREIVRQNPTIEHFEQKIESLEQLLDVMRERRQLWKES